MLVFAQNVAAKKFYAKALMVKGKVSKLAPNDRHAKWVKKGDLLINIASMPIAEKGQTNMMKLSYIEQKKNAIHLDNLKISVRVKFLPIEQSRNARILYREPMISVINLKIKINRLIQK